MPVDRFIKKLDLFAPLSDLDRHLVRKAVEETVDFEPTADILRRGENSRYVHVLLDGWACRYQNLADGQRQITAYLLPGVICDSDVDLVSRMDHSVGALSPCHVGLIRNDRFCSLLQDHPNMAKAVRLASIVEAAHDWLISVERRIAEERVAHLLCEMVSRLTAIGMSDGSCFELPVTQAHLADMMGLSIVHTNRSLRKLQSECLIDYSGRKISILDREGLMERAGFDPQYLHLQTEAADFAQTG
ncbi:MAG: Crp/Fnr family transcriptional regulator [Pararhizobium sp.]